MPCLQTINIELEKEVVKFYEDEAHFQDMEVEKYIAGILEMLSIKE